MGKSMEVSNIREFEMKFFLCFLISWNISFSGESEYGRSGRSTQAVYGDCTDENVWLLITWSILLRALYAIDKMLIIAGKRHMF